MSGLLAAITISINRELLLAKKPLYQGFLVVKLKSSLLKFDGHHREFVNGYKIILVMQRTREKRNKTCVFYTFPII
jgi:hypothetical protein